MISWPVRIFILSFLIVCTFCNSSYGALGDVVNSFAAPGPGSRGLAWDGTYLWHSDGFNNMIYKINPANGNVISSFSSASINSADLTFVGNRLWNVDMFTRTFYSVNYTTGPPWAVEFTKATNDYAGLEYDGTNLWSSDVTGGYISKMDLNGNIISSFPSPFGSPATLAWDGTYLWNADDTTDLTYKIDPATGNVIASFPSPGPDIAGLTFDGQYLWEADINTNQIYQLDAGYAGPMGPTPAPDGLVTLLTMLSGVGGWAGVARLRGRIRKRKTAVARKNHKSTI